MAKKKAAKKAISKRTGRPPKFAGEKVERTMSVGLTPDQLKLLEDAAKTSGKKKSEFLRDAALDAARRIVDDAAE